MAPNNYEIELSRVACLLDEISGIPIDPTIYHGYARGCHPQVRGGRLSDEEADAMVAELCKTLQSLDVTKYSLEMQMWWRDHQKADKARIEREIQSKKEKADRKAAIAKLTKYERKLLGLK